MDCATCDRCGKVIKIARPRKMFAVQLVKARTGLVLPGSILTQFYYDICPTCYAEFKRWLEGDEFPRSSGDD